MASPMERHPPVWIPSSNIPSDRRQVHQSAAEHAHIYSPGPLQTIGIPFNPSAQTEQPPVKRSRLVIPSKRAAQNRAAQRAFRERRDRYVKELETKAKEMEKWPEEMEQLRSENKQLRSKVAKLEQRVAELTGQTSSLSSSMSAYSGQTTPDTAPPPGASAAAAATLQHQQQSSSPHCSPPASSPSPPPHPHAHQQQQQLPLLQKMPSSPSSSSSSPALIQPLPSSPPPIYLHTMSSPMHFKASHSFSSPPDPHDKPHQMIHPCDETSTKTKPRSPFLMPSDDTSAVITSTVAAAEATEADTAATFLPEESFAPPPEMWGFDKFDLEFALDSYFQDEFGAGPLTSNLASSTMDHGPLGDDNGDSSGQVLDDLFAMLQTRQRPQIPIQLADTEPDLGFHQHTTAMLPPPSSSSFPSDLRPP
ncbi:hypothetical protein BX666DRAFT_1875812 [Dichotomocladium elegans]|nr:hypothetical protein BX666DRAFT_1875812 [Dichotomocladium elegans]